MPLVCCLFEMACNGAQLSFKDRIHLSYCALFAEKKVSLCIKYFFLVFILSI